MGVHIDKTGDDVLTLQVDAVLRGRIGQDLGKAAVLHPEAAVPEPAVKKQICVFEEHV